MPIRRRILVVVRVVRRSISGDLTVDMRSLALLGDMENLDDQDGAALTWRVPVCTYIERLVPVARLPLPGQPTAAGLTGEGVRRQRRLRAAGEDGRGATAHDSPSVAEAV